jgi:hypothetical protein
MAFFRALEEGGFRKDLFNLLRLNSMPELQMKYVPFIPFKFRYFQKGLLVKSYIV